MTTSTRLSIFSVGMSLAIFFVITYLLCILYGLAASAESMPLISILFPGFIWISWGSFFLGFLLSFAYGWYVAIVFVPLYNFFVVEVRNKQDPR